MTGAAYSTGTGWWNDAEGRAGTLRVGGNPQEANLLTANVRNGSVDDGVTQTLLAHKNGWSVNDLPMVLQEPQAFVKVIRSGARDADGNLPPEVWREEPTAPTMNVFDNGSDSRSTVLFVQPTEPVAFTPTGFANYQEGVGTLRARDAKGDTNVVVQGATTTALTANMAGAAGPCVDDAQGNRLIPVLLSDETVAKTLTTGNQRLNPEHETFVVQSTETFAFQPADQTLGKGALRAVRTDVAPTIALGDHHSDRGLRIVQVVEPIAFTQNQREEVRDLNGIASALTADSGSHQQTYILTAAVYQDSQYGVAGYDTAGTLRAGRIPEHQMVVQEQIGDE